MCSAITAGQSPRTICFLHRKLFKIPLCRKSFSRTRQFLARQIELLKMSKDEKNLWQGIKPGVQGVLKARDYRTASFAGELSGRGVDAGELVAADRNQGEFKEA